MALGKRVSLTLANASEEIYLDNLSVGFRVFRSNKLTMNTGEFNIRNLDDETAKLFIKSGTTIKFQVGWDDEVSGTMSTVFIGNILRQAEIKRETIDRVHVIYAGSMANVANIRVKELTDISQRLVEGITDPDQKKQIRADAKAEQARILNADNASSQIMCSLSYARGFSVATILQDLFVGLMGLNLNGLDNIAGLTLASPFVYQGSCFLALKALRRLLQGAGYNIYVDNTDCRVYSKSTPEMMLTVGYLSWDCGLVSLGELVDYTEDLSANENNAPLQTLKLTCLLDPGYQPNGVVHIDVPGLNGRYLIESVEFYGDNQGGEFLCDCLVSSYKGSTI